MYANCKVASGSALKILDQPDSIVSSEPTQGLLEGVLLLSHEIIDNSAPAVKSGCRGLEESRVDEEFKCIAAPCSTCKLVGAQRG